MTKDKIVEHLCEIVHVDVAGEIADWIQEKFCEKKEMRGWIEKHKFRHYGDCDYSVDCKRLLKLLEKKTAKPTIQELESILDNDEEAPIEILPNGEIRTKGQTSSSELSDKKPLTMKEDLGGEYACREVKNERKD